MPNPKWTPLDKLIEHVCGQSEFTEQTAYEGLEHAVDYDWQKRFVRLLGDVYEDSQKREDEK